MFRSWLFLILLIFAGNQLYSQQKTIKFDTYSLEDGLSQSSVTGIIQDRFGYIWISTQDGLNRFDGYTFKTFKNNPNDNTTIPNNYVHFLQEDEFGYLWFGTNRGIGKMDPKDYTVERISRNTIENLNGYIFTSLSFDKRGILWALTEKNGINRIDLTTHEIHTIKSIHGNDQIISTFIDRNQVLWVGTQTGQIYYAEYPYNTFEEIDYNSIFTIAPVVSFYQNERSKLMICTEKGLFYADADKKLQIVTEHAPVRYGAINCVFQEKNGNIWVGTKQSGLFLIEKDENKKQLVSQYQNNPLDNSSIADNDISCIFKDDNGIFWIGTEQGVSRFDIYKQGFTTITLNNDPSKGLIDYSVWSFAEDDDGNTYIGTQKDLTIFDRERNYYYHIIRNINTTHHLLSIYVENSNKIWLGYDDGLFILNIYDLREFKYSMERIDFLPEDIIHNARVYAISEADSNRLWLGSREGLTIMDKTDYSFSFYASGSGLGEGSVKTIYKDLANQTWVVTSNMGLYAVHPASENDFVFELCDINGHNDSNGQITCLLQTQPGFMWLGTYGEGIKKLDLVSRKTVNYTENEGLPNNVVYGLLEDNDGNIWASTNNGISKLNPKTEQFTNYTTKDGLQSNEYNSNAFFKSSNGRLFFGGINGYNVFDPAEISINPNAPKTVITSVKLALKGSRNKTTIAENIVMPDVIELDYEQNDLTFEFMATNFSKPEQNRFKCILRGKEDEFNYLENENRAHYMHVDPGEYTFEVYAQSADGVWSEKPATIQIIITPPFWQTWWFRITGILLIVAIGLYWYRRRIDTIRRQKVRLEIEVVKRTRQVTEQSKKIQDQKQKVEIQKAKIEHQNELLEKEKEKVEQLLLNILPVGTAEELKNKGRSKARYYKNVSVMFTDFVGFSKIAEDMKPQDLVQKLDGYFSSFDEIIEKYDLEKIKTIGDSYMCAGGVPIRNKSNAIEVTLAALEIKNHMMNVSEEVKKRGENAWKIRIGINTGEVIAGVIGLKRFAYDIWGSTVNQAQRMEMHGQPGTVNVSGNTYEFIAPYFDCVYRGKIQTKHKGMLDMYYVKGIKPELSVDGEGIVPNDDFWKIVDLHLYSSINYMKAERHIMKVLEDELSPKLLYHSINHTIDVTQAVERLAIMEGITDEDLFLLKSAATYHDAGFVERYDSNEEIGIKMARDILPKYGYTEKQLDIIDGLIKSTEIPQSPKTHLEQIMCDADLDYLGRDDFHVIADYLRRELREHGKLKSDRQWDEIQIAFLNQHTYFTKSAIKLRQAKKEKHIREIEERLKRDQYKD
jgi:ligand-binding sensor domain-containing protein/class 3 adenylate cyclase/predicted metal-dependent HD superfamily phosphohydrolase